MRFVHAHRDDQSGQGGQRGHDPHGGVDAERVGDDTGQQGAGREAAVAPEPVHAHGPGPPGGMGDVADRGEQGRVDQRGARAERGRGDRPRQEGVRDGDHGQGERLQPHAGDDHPLAAPPVRQCTGGQLADSPHGRVQRREDADPADGQAGRGEQDREQPPGEAVVEVVDQPGLAGRGQGRFLEAGLDEHLPVGELVVQVVVASVGAGDVADGLETRVFAGLLHGEGGQSQTESREGDAEQEGRGPQPVGLGQISGGQRGRGDGGIPGGLVQSHRESPPGRADEVDLHHHGGGPGQSLADAEQHVGEDHPAPRGCPDEQQRHREGDQPPGDEHRFAPVPVGEGAGEVVGDRLRQAEDEDERQPGGVGADAEFLLGEQRQHGAFLTEHAADERVDDHQQGELGEVAAQAQSDLLVGRGGGWRGGVHERLPGPVV